MYRGVATIEPGVLAYADIASDSQTDTAFDEITADIMFAGESQADTIDTQVRSKPAMHVGKAVIRAVTPLLEMGAATYSKKPESDDSYVMVGNSAAVCDGVGSSINGGEASRLATSVLAERLAEVERQSSRKAAAKCLDMIFMELHAQILELQAETGLPMASTVSTVSLVAEGDKPYLVVGNIGDSPVYVTKDGKTREITRYHSGGLAKKPADRPALGKVKEPTADFYFIPVDRTSSDSPTQVKITSNGVRKNDEKMKKVRKVARKGQNPEKTATKLVRDIKGKSGDDRTAVVISA